MPIIPKLMAAVQRHAAEMAVAEQAVFSVFNMAEQPQYQVR
jgi:hypothetical protein